jgi:hypothetical protein
MFYELEKINSKLNCLNCQRKMNLTSLKPRVLPCGETICDECAHLVKVDDENKFECLICHERHHLTTTELIQNKSLIRLIEEKPVEPFRGETVNVLKRKLHQLSIFMNEFATPYKSRRQILDDHCNNIRFRLELIKESLIEYVHKYSNEFGKQIDAYEQECQRNLNESDFRSTELLNETDQFLKEWCLYLARTDMSERDLNKALEKIDRIKIRFEVERENLKRHIFNGKLLQFVENDSINIKADLLGKIEMQKLNPIFKELVRIDIREVCKHEGNESLALSTFRVDRLKNGTFVIGFSDEFSFKALLTLNRTDGEALKTNKLNLFTKANPLFDFLTCENRIVHSDFCFKQQLFKMCVRDEKFQLLYDLTLSSDEKKVCTHDSKIYILMKNHEIKVYTLALQFLSTISPELLIKDDNLQLEVSHNVYLTRNSHKMRVYLVDEEREVKFLVPNAKFFVRHDEKKIVTYYSEAKEIVHFNFNGDIVYARTLGDYAQNLSFFLDSNYNMCFYDEENLYV